uniref:Fibronectin type-III domain-containing protein n=1 Tax=Astatotilapia calliptera TaxID=8154 RepID=A0AAX7TG83_ASTCA
MCARFSQTFCLIYITPCVPTNVSIHYNLSTARVMWNTASGAASYSVQAVSDRNLTVACNTSNTHCSLTALQCSHTYSITVMTQSLACNNTVSSAPYRLVTEPCPPTNVQSDLALGYVAYFDNQNGHYTSCMSTNTSCVVSGLMCGTVYSVWVKALGQQYNTPCLPRDMTVEVNCTSDNAVLVSWNGTYGTTNISLMAVVGGSLQTLCTTQQESCNMTSLSCGETYSLSINASNDQCSLSTQTLSNFTTRPCPPQRVAVNLQCSSRTAVLSWEERSNVELYTASAIKASGGEEKTCDSVTSSCQFSGLDCGEMYNFTVTGHNRGCCSQPSSAVFIHTEPCPPTNVSAEVLCESDEMKISWQEASGAESFLVTGSMCNGIPSSPTFFKTGGTFSTSYANYFNVYVLTVLFCFPFWDTAPCIPRGLATDAECGFDVGSVSWQPTDGAETYIAVATGLDGHTHRCISNTASCTWSDLHCGEEYSVVVRAKSNNCTSLPSNISVQTWPCKPIGVSASQDCLTSIAVVTWQPSNGSDVYTATMQTDTGVSKMCMSDTNKCSFLDLMCGQNFSVSVTASNQQCDVTSGPATSLQSGEDCMATRAGNAGFHCYI